MEAEYITINKKKYRILERLYRTKGGKNQKLQKTMDASSEKNMVFYILERGNIKYWMKENNFPDSHYHNRSNSIKETKDEFDRGKQCNFRLGTNECEVTTVKYIDYEDNRIVQEYCDYTPLRESDLTADEKKLLRSTLSVWIRLLPVDNYDFGTNNIMVKREEKLLVKMIDFANSPDKTKEKCKQLIKTVRI